MKLLVTILLLVTSLSAQDQYVFNAALVERKSDSTALFVVDVPDWGRNYKDFKQVEQVTMLWDRDSLVSSYIIQYDSIVTAYPVNDYCFSKMVYQARLSPRYNVYDGDGFYAKIRVPVWSQSFFGSFDTITRKIRGYAFDTYEIRPRPFYPDGTRKTHKQYNEEKSKATEARDLARGLLRDFCFTIRYVEKYRNTRWVCETRFIDGPFDGMTIKAYMKRAGLTTGKYER